MSLRHVKRNYMVIILTTIAKLSSRMMVLCRTFPKILYPIHIKETRIKFDV